MKYSEVTALSAAELKSKVKESQAELFEARMKHSLGQLANPMNLRRLRKDIARMKMATATGLAFGQEANQSKGATKAKAAAPKKAAPKKASVKRGRK